MNSNKNQYHKRNCVIISLGKSSHSGNGDIFKQHRLTKQYHSDCSSISDTGTAH